MMACVPDWGPVVAPGHPVVHQVTVADPGAGGGATRHAHAPIRVPILMVIDLWLVAAGLKLKEEKLTFQPIGAKMNT